MKVATARQWHEFSSTSVLDAELAQFVAARLSDALAARGTASLAVSGGRTPAGFLRALAVQPLDWSHIYVTLADERWVAPDHADSNARLIREILLAGPASAAYFLPLFNDAESSARGQAITENQLTALHWPLDVVVLGMGDDGHTASLFPQAPELAEACTTTARCVAITPVTAPHERISLTLSALAAARCLIVHITGQNKRDLLDAALSSIPKPHLPIRRVLDATRSTCHLFWAP